MRIVSDKAHGKLGGYWKFYIPVSRRVRLLLSLFALSVPSIPVALAQIVPHRLPGTWQSGDYKLVITSSEQKLTVHGLGKCHPDWRYWGKVPLSLIAPSIQSRSLHVRISSVEEWLDYHSCGSSGVNRKTYLSSSS
jgi:hypothetical protein